MLLSRLVEMYVAGSLGDLKLHNSLKIHWDLTEEYEVLFLGRGCG